MPTTIRKVRITTTVQHMRDDGCIEEGDEIASSWIDVPEGDFVSLSSEILVQRIEIPQFVNSLQIFSHGEHDKRAKEIAELEKMNA